MRCFRFIVDIIIFIPWRCTYILGSAFCLQSVLVQFLFLIHSYDGCERYESLYSICPPVVCEEFFFSELSLCRSLSHFFILVVFLCQLQGVGTALHLTTAIPSHTCDITITNEFERPTNSTNNHDEFPSSSQKKVYTRRLIGLDRIVTTAVYISCCDFCRRLATG